MAIRRIGQILVDLGFITDEQLEMLLDEQQQRPGEMLGRIAEDMGLITDDQLVQALAEQMNMQVVSLAEIELERELLDTISETMAQMYRVIPVMKEENTLTLATCDPQNLAIQDELRNFLGYDIRLVIADRARDQRAMDRYYARRARASRAC
jgi:type IV pilus assembly protein PilB